MNLKPRSNPVTFEDEVYFNVISEKKTCMAIAFLSTLGMIISVITLLVVMPLVRVEPFVLLVDKTTGITEQIVEVEPLALQLPEAVLQAELVRYVIGRETFDRSDNEIRINSIDERSDGAARESLRQTWAGSNENYPPKLYKKDTTVKISVKSVSILGDGIAQVRFDKKISHGGINSSTRPFVAVLNYSFEPKIEKTIKKLWDNPQGFVVKNYRIDAESLGVKNAK